MWVLVKFLNNDKRVLQKHIIRCSKNDFVIIRYYSTLSLSKQMLLYFVNITLDLLYKKIKGY